MIIIILCPLVTFRGQYRAVRLIVNTELHWKEVLSRIIRTRRECDRRKAKNLQNISL
jgi:hypothetical protein